MSGDPEGLVSFEACGATFTAVIGFRAMKAAETHYDLPFLQVVQKVMPQVAPEDTADAAKITAAAAGLRFTDIGNLLGFALLKHHPGLTEADIDDLIDDIGLGRASAVIGQALASALVQEDDSSSPQNPPPPARRKSKTG